MATWPTCKQSGYITPGVLGVPKPSTRGQKSAMATWHTCGQSGYITPAVLGVPNAQRGGKKQKWLPAPHVGKVATSPLRFWGCPTLSAGRKNGNGCLAHMGAKWLHHPCGLGGPKRSARGQQTEMELGPHVGKLTTSPLPCWRSPTLHARTKNRNGYLGHMWAKRLHHPCHLEGPQWSARGPKTEMATWPTCKQSGYITPGVLGVPKPSTRGRKSAVATWRTCGQTGYITPAVLGVPNTQRGGKKQKWPPGPNVGKVATSPLRSWGCPTLSAGRKNGNGCLAHMWAKWLHHPCRLAGPQRSAWGQQNGNGYLAHMWAKWLHHPCPLGSPERSARGRI